VLGIVAIVLCAIALSGIDLAGGSLGRHAWTFCFSGGFALFLWAILCGPRELAWPLELWILQLLGCMCYSIYAWHGIALNVMVPPDSEIERTWALLPAFLAITFALSTLSYRYIEFGARSDWRTLFLLRAPAPSTTPRA
jgi:peptidoglycan/LPS O-acetylase OafA/YrhL